MKLNLNKCNIPNWTLQHILYLAEQRMILTKTLTEALLPPYFFESRNSKNSLIANFY